MKEYSELTRARRWYKYYLAAAVFLLIGAGAMYWIYQPLVSIDIVLAISLFVLIISNIQTFNLAFELEHRIEDLEEKLEGREQS